MIGNAFFRVTSVNHDAKKNLFYIQLSDNSEVKAVLEYSFVKDKYVACCFVCRSRLTSTNEETVFQNQPSALCRSVDRMTIILE